MQTKPIHIGIIGFGPKGLYGFERLLASLKHYTETKVNIHLFNESASFGAGWVYHKDQPDYLLMNYPNHLISLQPISKPSPICEILSLSEWLSLRTKETVSELKPKISSRKTIGNYLTFYFNELCKHLPSHISVSKYVTTVTDIKQEDKSYKISTTNTLDVPFCNSLLIATGHKPSIKSKVERNNTLKTIPFVYPIPKQLGIINPQSTVIIKGIGLTAIDAILGLTEGCKGKFQSNKDSTITYLKSGLEPKHIFPYSRTGIPIIPRGERTLDYKQTSFFLKNYLQSNSFETHSVDFEKDLLPRIKQDIVGEFYNTLFELYDVSIEQINNFEELKKRIEKFHQEHPKVKIFKAEDLLTPTLASSQTTYNSVHDFWSFWCIENEKTKSPFVAAASAWRYLSKDFNTLYSQQKLTEASKKEFQTKCFGLFNKISYGPPLVNIKKILALIEANILDFRFAESPTISEHSISKSNQSTTYNWSIDARLPRGFSSSKSVLFNAEHSSQLFKTLKISENNNELQCTKTGHPLNANGNPIKSIVFYGTPTENILFDNDTLSRTHNDTVTLWAKDIAQHLNEKSQLISS
jgi:hypothetical protein